MMQLDDALFSPVALERHRRTFALFARKQLERQSVRIGDAMRYVDVVRDVVNMLPVYWIAAVLKLPAADNDATQDQADSAQEYHPERYFQGFANLAEYAAVWPLQSE
jgi:linoleate 10R-lipoxygenase